MLFFFLCCGTPDKEQHNPMLVDIDVRHQVSLFDIFERVELIPLETTDESIFRRIEKVIYRNGMLFIHDFEGRRIFTFDSVTGSFLFKIDNRGSGPEEYLHIADFEIDQNDRLLILDPFLNSLIEYDLSGRFLRRTRLPEITNFYNSLRCLGDDIIAFWTFDGANRLKFFDRRTNSIFQEHAPVVVDYRNEVYLPRAFAYRNYLVKDSYFDNAVYEIFADGTYTIAYTWDFGRLNNTVSMAQRFPEQRLTTDEFMNWAERLRNSEVVNYIFLHIGGNKKYRYARLMRNNQSINLFHSIADEHTLVFTEFSEGASFVPLFWTDEFVIGHGPFADLFEDTIPDAILDERNREIKRNICEFDNPVLIKYFFRR